ncbi:ABC transporter ATP-binding protein [Arthrobacter jiangjiafuii]
MSMQTTNAADTVRTRGLSIEGASLSLGDGSSSVQALDAVSLRVEPGELVAVVGPSGAGKSSLLAVAGALTTPDSGRVSVNGTDLSGLGKAAKARFRLENIGFVFQSGNLIPALTAAEQLELVHRMAKMPGVFNAHDLLDAVGMGHKLKSRPDQLSGGERQRVGIARALVTKPTLLLVDEPTAALDRRRSQEVVELLARETHTQGVATVMVTHDHDVLHHCDRVVEMVDGRLAG